MAGPHQYTVLFAEDEVPLRVMFARVFETNGFHVLSARNGKEALQLAAEYPGTIDLLVSDVQMPEMTGPDLARELRNSRPDIRVMLMSGYPEGVLLLDKGWIFLQKPVLPQAIMTKMMDILGKPPSRDVDQGGDSGFDAG